MKFIDLISQQQQTYDLEVKGKDADLVVLLLERWKELKYGCRWCVFWQTVLLIVAACATVAGFDRENLAWFVVTALLLLPVLQLSAIRRSHRQEMFDVMRSVIERDYDVATGEPSPAG